MNRKITSLFLLVPLGFVFPLTACSSTTLKDDPNLYHNSTNLNESQYNYESDITKRIRNMTVSVGFEYVEKNETATKPSYSSYIRNNGTAWIYNVKDVTNPNETSKTYDFYFATNLHVVKVLSFNNQIDPDTNKTNEIFAYSITFAKLNSTPNTKNDYLSQNQLGTVYVSEPSIAYTTVNDDSYNSLFKNKLYGQENGNFIPGFQAMSDIAILKYTITEDEKYFKDNVDKTNTFITENFCNPEGFKKNYNSIDVNDFLMWLKSYQVNLIPVLQTNFGDFENKKYSFSYYMGGFPAQKDFGIEEITWRGFSNFKLNPVITSQNENAYQIYTKEKSGNPSPIYFKSKNYDINQPYTYKFVSAGKEGYFYAHSNNGASGSPVVVIIDSKPYIVGIYWGVTVFEINGTQRYLGVCDFLSDNNSHKTNNTTFNIVENINKALGW